MNREQELKKVFISRNYKAQHSAAGKAKIDCEVILEKNGFKNIGLKRSTTTNNVIGFFITLLSLLWGLIILSKNSILCVQYPTKKYYNFIIKIAKLKGCKVVTVIHDLRAHRKQKMAVDTEIQSLNCSDIIISHNNRMTEWLKHNGLTSQTIDLNIFDYLCDTPRKSNTEEAEFQKFKIVFAGVLEERKNGFIYKLDELKEQSYEFNLYGIGYDEKAVSKNSIIQYQGVFPADEIVCKLEGDFGVVWDGISIDECAGSFGEYLKINNPHKTSMYLRAGLPILIWKEAAMANFVVENNVGIAVSSLKDISNTLASLSNSQYTEMKKNAENLSSRLGEGVFFSQAISKANATFTK